MKLVSVILPTYNAAAFISDAIESVLAQTYSNIELIIIDDGSTDETEQVASKYSGLKYIRQPNLGVASARNAGILVAEGCYITFIDADDLWLPEKTQLQVDYLNQTGLKWCYCDSYFSWFGKDKIIGPLSSNQGVFEGHILTSYVFNKFEIPLPSMIIEREIFDKVGLFDEFLKVGEDTDLWARIAIQYPIGYIDRPLVRIRKRPGSLSQIAVPETAGTNRRYILHKLKNLAPEELEDKYNELVAISYRNQGAHSLRWGEVSEAKSSFRKAIQQQPFKVRYYIFLFACFFRPIPYIFYKMRWLLGKNRLAYLRPGWWVDQ